MKRLARLLPALALALLCAGGFAASEGATPAPTLPPVRKILSISLSVKPAELVVPGDVTLTFTITNTSKFDAENVYISSAGGLHIEPLGQIDAERTQVFGNRVHTVTQEELDAGLIAFTLSHDGIAGDKGTVNYTVECPIEKAIARPDVEFTRQFAGAFARLGDVATITYRVRNTGNVVLSNIRVSDTLGDFSARHEALEVGESRLFTSKVTIAESAVSQPRLSYAVPDEDDKEYTAALDDARIELSSEQLEATLTIERDSARYGDTVAATLTVANFGNVDFYDIAVYDETYGGLVADGMHLLNGDKPLVLTREYPVRGGGELQLRVRALSQSGAIIETLTEPVPLRLLPSDGGGAVSVYAEARYPQIASGGSVPVDVYVVNEGEADIEGVTLSERSGDQELWTFAVLANRFTTHRRVYVPVMEDAQLSFEVSYRDENGQRRTALSPPVAIEIARGGHRLGSEDAEEPYSGKSLKLGQSPAFLAMAIAAGAMLLGLTGALLLSSRRAKRARREKMALKKRQLQEELGKTNRFTPVKRPERKRKEAP